jgi:hypothetical protein
MIKRILLATLAVFVAWEILDYFIHMVILSSSYEATAHLWRSADQMKTGLMLIVVILVSLLFVTIYARLISPKNLRTAISFGFLFGLAGGISMGYGSYSVLPIPYHMALDWFLGTLVEATVAGLLVGLIVKEEKKDTT